MIDASVIPESEHFVFVRRTGAVNGETAGWKFDPNLRCQEVTIRAGLGLGRATFNYVPLDMTIPSIESIAARYHPDTQVRVELHPPGLDTPSEGEGLAVFEGVLERQPLSVVSHNGEEDETCDFVAVAMPWLDARTSQHHAVMRWYHRSLDDSGGAGGPLGPWLLIETRTVPAAFNYRGRANMDTADAHKRPAAGLLVGALDARGFTHDDDPTGGFWTVGEAIKSLLVQWLYGSGTTARTRATGVDLDTLVALGSDAFTDDGQFGGLGKVLPETDVTGLFLFEAIDAVCRAGGFEFAVEPDMAMEGRGDRLYLLRLWRRHAGPPSQVRLPKRGAFPAGAAETRRQADVNRLTLMRDNSGIINEVIARGPVAIEASIELRPLWSPDELEAQKKDPPGEGYEPTPASNALAPGLGGAGGDDAYHQKHVQGGGQFSAFGHVGRAWGADCTGASAALFYQEGTEETPKPYDQNAKGFDWIAELGINGSPGDQLTAERVANGVDTPVAWTTRVRRPEPLTRDTARLRGQRYVLEVSEKAVASPGTRSWVDITDRVSFSVLTDFFGIRFSSIPNLASVNAEALASGSPAAVADSWWQKILDQDLLFRLTANVAADHESIYVAKQQASSGTAYSRGWMLDVDVTEVWASPDSTLNSGPSSSWTKLPAAAGNASLVGDLTDAVKSAAERVRDAHEGTQWRASFDTFLLEPWKWRIGDRIREVSGRGLSLATNAGSGERHPAIVEVKVVLAGPGGDGAGQGVFVSLTDTSMRGGV